MDRLFTGDTVATMFDVAGEIPADFAECGKFCRVKLTSPIDMVDGTA